MCRKRTHGPTTFRFSPFSNQLIRIIIERFDFFKMIFIMWSRLWLHFVITMMTRIISNNLFFCEMSSSSQLCKMSLKKKPFFFSYVNISEQFPFIFSQTKVFVRITVHALLMQGYEGRTNLPHSNSMMGISVPFFTWVRVFQHG